MFAGLARLAARAGVTAPTSSLQGALPLAARGRDRLPVRTSGSGRSTSASTPGTNPPSPRESSTRCWRRAPGSPRYGPGVALEEHPVPLPEASLDPNANREKIPQSLPL